MEKERRVLDGLIEKLQSFETILTKVKNKYSFLDFALPKDKLRSCENMKNVLDSLVKKTTDGKNCDEDIAVTLHDGGVLDNQPSLENLITSEEYLSETKALMNSTSGSDVLHHHLLIFHDLLGDILHSVCHINNYHLKLASGILVKDLVKVKNQYISIWELLFSKINKTNKSQNTEDLNVSQRELEKNINELLKCLQLCLKEMSKVKLEIEHFFKVNLIEMQFNEDSELQITSNVAEDGEIEEEFLFQQQKLVDDRQVINEGLKKNLTFTFPESKLYNPPSTVFSVEPKETESKIKHVTSCFFPPSNGSKQDWYNQEPCGDFFNQTILCPTDFLFFDPTTVFLQSKIQTSQKTSLPKIYSVDSMKDDISETGGNPSMHNTSTKSNKVQITDMEKEESTENITIMNNENTEDLFGGNYELNTSESQRIDQQKKISSLLNMLKTNQINDVENIFEANPLKIENSDTSYSNRECMTNSQNHNVNRYKTTIQKPNTSKNNNLNNYKSKDGMVHVQDKKTFVEKNNESNRNYEKQFSYQEFEKELSINLLGFENNNVIYDKRPVIELFRSTEINNPSNSGSDSQKENSFCAWPVEAKYIHVSGDRKCHSTASDDNSISLAKSFEKSFYALHLNKQYEHNQLYDGDLIVLDTPEEIVNERGSSYSLLNQSYVVFDVNHCEVKEKKNEANNNNDNIYLQAKNNPVVNYHKELIPTVKKNLDVSNTMAVQFAECGNSFMVKKKNIQRNNLDYFNMNNFNDNNWNSFISIYTSKVGPSARINHHRMFGNFINNISLDPLSENNLFGNIHTLTSNGGPYRLFDINGYPLTDSAGNVLKDPYGKSIVTLDSTGFPKNNVEVFDAAGNSPEDINFDPTQKPKTNTIIIKLTDNFKRPLHLFDKYGRPLTDAYGKLLVNIHGRPLLRFDNFGRPNTDYRGGPLYTDDGFRWSYKTGESLSQEQFSNEKVTANKLTDTGVKREMNSSCDPINPIKDDHEDSNEKFLEDNESNRNKLMILRNRNSDIWDKVENVLQHLPKKKNTDLKASQTSVIINNVSIPEAPIENEFLNSIIYHNNIVQQDINHKLNITNPNNNITGLTQNTENIMRITKPLIEHSKNYISAGICMDNNRTNNFNLVNNKDFIYCKPIETNLGGNGINMLENHTNCLGKGVYMENTQAATVPYPFFSNIFVKNTCSKCLNHKKFSHQQPECTLPNKITCNHSRKIIEDEENQFTYNGLMTTSTSKHKNCIRNTRSYFTFRNHDYLNNLCNEILKQQIDYKVKAEKNSECINNLEDWTDTSYTRITSSSKHTRECSSTNTALPGTRKDPCRTNSEGVERLKDNYDQKKHKISKDLYTQNRPCLDEIKYYNDCFRQKDSDKYKKGKIQVEKTSQEDKNHDKEQVHSLSSSSLEPSLCINVLNQEDKHYEIKVAEKIKRNHEIKNDKNKNLDKKNSLHYNDNLKRNKDCDVPIVKKEFQNVPPTGEMYSHDIHSSKNQKEKQKDSPFRFPSDSQMKSTIAMKNSIEVKYIRECNADLDSSANSKKEFTYENQMCLNGHSNREDNLNNSKKYDDQENIMYFYPNERYSYPDLSTHKKEPIMKYHNAGRRYANGIKKLPPQNKECKFVSFLGSPVKYVLNKIDNRLSSRQHNGNKLNSLSKTMKRIVSKEENSKTNYEVNSINKNKNRQAQKIKPFYSTSKPDTKEITREKTTSNEKSSKASHMRPSGGGLLALKSKSCVELLCQEDNFIMSYSGLENDSQTLNPGKGLPPSAKHITKSSSTTSYMSHCRMRDDSQHQQRKKYAINKFNPKNEQIAFKVNSSGKKLINQYYTNEKNSKNRKKKPEGKSTKPTLAANKVKPKSYGLFRKLEPKGKQKRRD